MAPINVESQPPSYHLHEQIIQPNSPTLFLDVDMIGNNQFVDSSSLRIMERTQNHTDDHHVLDDLLDHRSFISNSIIQPVNRNLT